MPHRPRFRTLSIAAAGILALLGSSESSRSDPGDATQSAQGTSTFALRTEQGSRIIDITNATFSTTGSHIPGRPEEERLLLRTTIRTREVVDEKGLEATVTVDAWPLGTDRVAKPLYTVSVDGVRATVMDNALLVIERGTEDVEWWSIYALGTGAHFFDTFARLIWFSSSPDVHTPRYVGLDVPPDDTPDERLRDPKVVGVLAYATPERVVRRLLVTCSDTARAALLRSYWDTTRELSFLRIGTLAEPGPPTQMSLTWRSTDLATPGSRLDTLSIPISNDDLDFARAQLPACMTLAPWSP
jgi:hypothetical protein